MGKRISQLTQITAAQLAQTDLVAVVDVSAGQTKYATIKDLTGLPDIGWTSTGESWTYSSYNSTLHTGVITVPTDATTKYGVDMWVRFSQTTGGTKYGRITAVTATTLTVQFPNSVTLANEAITSPVYSSAYAPVGAPKRGDFVYSQANAGTAGGTLYFENDGGRKRLWGELTTVTGSNPGTSNGVTFPTGLFSTAPAVVATVGPNATTNNQDVNIAGGASLTTTSVALNVWASGSTATEKMQIIAMSYQ